MNPYRREGGDHTKASKIEYFENYLNNILRLEWYQNGSYDLVPPNAFTHETGIPIEACTMPLGYSENADDCNDINATQNPFDIELAGIDCRVVHTGVDAVGLAAVSTA